MARTLIRNITGQTLGLPLPYGGILLGGSATVVPETDQTVIAYLGGPDGMRHIWDVFPVNENTPLGPYTLASGALQIARAVAATETDFSFNSHKLTNVATPTAATDAATKGYVDGADAGKVPTSRSVLAGTSLSGGGPLTADVTINFGIAPGAAGNVLTSDGAGAWTSAPSAGGIASIVEGSSIDVDNTDPANPIVSFSVVPGAAGNLLTSDGAGAWTSAPPAGGGSIYPQRPAAWGNEYLWWKLEDAPQSGAAPNIAANSGSAGAASLTATNNPTGGNSNGGAFYDKSPMFGVSGPFSAVSRFRGSGNTLQGADALYQGVSAFTLSAWVNISESGGVFTCNVATKKHPSGYSVGLLTLGGRAYYLVRTAGGEITYYTAANLLTYGLPNLLSLTYDGTTVRGYLNGQEVVSGAQSGSIVWATGAGSEWEIGQISGGIERYDIWDVRSAPSVRSAAQLLADYKTGMGFSY